MHESLNNLALRGTTTVGVVCKDGVILASDTRVTTGTFIAHKKGKKVYQIDEHMAMTISGVVADAQQIVNLLKVNAQLYRLNNQYLMPISAAARLISNVLFSTRQAPLIAQVLIGGVDDVGPHVFSLDPFGSLTEEKFVATGSGSPVAYGVLENKYKEDMFVKDLLSVVVRSIASAMKRNSATGDSFDITVIDHSGCRELTDEEKRSIQ